MKFLLHTSKTMRQKSFDGSMTRAIYHNEAQVLMGRLNEMSEEQIVSLMHVSPKLAQTVIATHKKWSTAEESQSVAVDTFVGDIYSGLQASSWDDEDRMFAQGHLLILSGLYGILRPLDGVMPYRLEMGYSLSGPGWKNLYEFWSPLLIQQFKKDELIVNLSAVEYTKALLPMLSGCTIIQPKFLTLHPATKEPTFVVVHAKIARGAFASWIIRNRIHSRDLEEFTRFNELGYRYNKELSSDFEPVFVCEKFKGIGLSVRLR